MTRMILFFGICFPLLCLAGCFSQGKSLKVEFVEGIVTLDGKPVSGANISFIPVDREGAAETAGGYSDAHGVYRLTSMNGEPERGAVVGEYRVIVEKVSTEVILQPEKEYGTYEPALKSTSFLPEVYRDSGNTPLRATVNKGKNKIDIEIKSKP